MGRFYVDAVPVRVFRNNEAVGVHFPNAQAVGIYASLWDGSSWATQGGAVPLDWNAAPFIASFKVRICNSFEPLEVAPSEEGFFKCWSFKFTLLNEYYERGMVTNLYLGSCYDPSFGTYSSGEGGEFLNAGILNPTLQ